MKRRIVCMAISCMMALSLLPYTAFADTEEGAALPAEQTEQEMEAQEEPAAVEEAGQSAEESLRTQEESEAQEVPEEDAAPEATTEQPSDSVQQEETEQQNDAVQPEETDQKSDSVQPEEDAQQNNAVKAKKAEQQGTPEEPDAPIDLSAAEVEVSGIKAATYTGKAVKQDPAAIVVTVNEQTLAYQKDYTLAYENNVNAGRAVLIVRGAGRYTGEERFSFRIDQIDLSSAGMSAIAARTYNGYAYKPSPAVTLGTAKLVLNRDYTLSYHNNINAGTATVTVTGKGNYKGTARANYTILPKDMSGASVAAISPQAFTGKTLRPHPAVTLGKVTLVWGTDYKLRFRHNRAVGTAYVTITGKGNYTGTIERTFEIKDKKAKKVKLSGMQCRFKDKTYVKYRLKSIARPYYLYLTARKGGAIDLKWADCVKKQGANISGYIILRKTESVGTYKEIARVGKGTTTYKDTSKKKKNQIYRYAVVSYKKKKDGTIVISDMRTVRGVTYESKLKNPYSPVLSKKNIFLYTGRSKTLKLDYSKYKKACTTWTRWSSTNPAVATVSATGKVKAKGPGTCTIIARTANGRGFRCTVRVAKSPARAVVAKAKKEIGYKATGRGTYGTRFSKYAKELDAMGDIYNGPKYGYDWCDIFVDWCFIKTLGKAKALRALNQPKNDCGAGCRYSADFFRAAGRFSEYPAVGAQIFYDWNGDGHEDHTGIVERYDATYVYTIEGNVGGGNGKVARRKHKRTYSCITGYGLPRW